MVFPGTSPGTFGTGSSVPGLLLRPFDFDAGDIDRDGFLDFAVPLADRDEVRIVLSNGAGGFNLGSSFSVPKTPKVARVLDYNLDGLLHLVVASEGDHVLSFHKGDGTGRLSTADVRPASVRRPTWMTAADFDGDGRTDIAVVPDSAVDGDPPGVVALRNTNCRTRQLYLDQDVSTCDLPGQPFLAAAGVPGLRRRRQLRVLREPRRARVDLPGNGIGGRIPHGEPQQHSPTRRGNTVGKRSVAKLRRNPLWVTLT